MDVQFSVVDDDDLHIVSTLWSAYGGGHGYDKARASHPLSKLLGTPTVLGQAARAALKQLYVVRE